jgi:hypothetical protein
MFAVPLRSISTALTTVNNLSYIVGRVRFRGNVFTEPLPSNEFFRLSGVMSQYTVLL